MQMSDESGDSPSTVKDILVMTRLFVECTDGAMTLVLHEGLERIGKGVFNRCEGLTKVDMPPSTVKGIGDGAFQECKGLEFLSLNDGLERIGEEAFLVCEGLTKVDIPSTVKDIGDAAFQEMQKVEDARSESRT
eukprot:scaffold22475_cov69-Cylindrotheca_fusiformis.AAC.3